MQVCKKLLGILLISNLLVSSLKGQSIPVDEIVYPDKIYADQEYRIKIHSNYILKDCIIVDEKGNVIPHLLNAIDQKDVYFINNYSVLLLAPNKETQLQEMMITWDLGMRSEIQVYPKKIDILKSEMPTNRNNFPNVVQAGIKKPLVQIYPNPSQGEFLYIEFDNVTEKPNLMKVFDIFGQLVDEMKLENLRTVYRANRLINGNYIFTFYHDQNIFSEKVKIAR